MAKAKWQEQNGQGKMAEVTVKAQAMAGAISKGSGKGIDNGGG
jgi:hypothetical protein